MDFEKSIKLPVNKYVHAKGRDTNITKINAGSILHFQKFLKENYLLYIIPLK